MRQAQRWRATIFWTDADRERFLGHLTDNVHVAGVVLYAYGLRDNHSHLLLGTPRANLSRFMQRLGTAYVLCAPCKRRRPGTRATRGRTSGLILSPAWVGKSSGMAADHRGD